MRGFAGPGEGWVARGTQKRGTPQNGSKTGMQKDERKGNSERMARTNCVVPVAIWGLRAAHGSCSCKGSKPAGASERRAIATGGAAS